MDASIPGQVDDLVVVQSVKGSVEQVVNALIESAWPAIQEMIQVAFALRGSEEMPFIENVNIRTLADADGPPIRPERHPRWFESYIYAHQLPTVCDLSHARNAWLADGARRTRRLCEAGDTQQEMA